MAEQIDLGQFIWPDVSQGRQPQQNRGPSGSNSLAFGLTRLGIPGVDFGATAFGNSSGAPGSIAIPQGVAANFSGSQVLQIGAIDANPITIMVGALADTASSPQYIFGVNYAGVEPYELRLNSGQLQFSSYNMGAQDLALGVTAPTAGSYFTSYATLTGFGASVAATLGYFNSSGVLSASTSQAASLTNGGPGSACYIGGSASSGSPWRFYSKPILWFATWNRVLSAVEIAQVAANPWQLFATPMLGLPSKAASGGASASISGVAATGAIAAPTAATSSALTLASTYATGAVGAPAASASAGATLAGVLGTGAVGSLALASAPTLVLAGVAAIGAVGAIGASASGNANATLPSVAATGAVGTLTASGGAINGSTTLSGLAGTGAAGALSTESDSSLVLASASAIGAAGAIVALSQPTVALASVYGTGALGALQPATSTVSVTLQGIAAEGDVGAIIIGGQQGLDGAGIGRRVEYVIDRTHRDKPIDGWVCLPGVSAQSALGPVQWASQCTQPGQDQVTAAQFAAQLERIAKLAPRQDATVGLPGLTCQILPFRPRAPVAAAEELDEELEQFALLAAAAWEKQYGRPRRRA